MSLTKEQRDALPKSDFAVPGKRELPIHDETHVRLAWNMVDRTAGLSDEERKAARAHILRRAKKLGIDTAGWERVHASAEPIHFRIEAMSLALPEVKDHPNRAPFSGVLTRVDRPSDKAPNGSAGKRIFLTKEAAEAAIPSLLGMAIDYTADLGDHDPQAKIGIITEAEIEADGIAIKGFFYANDFPAVVKEIRQKTNLLGFSFEADRIRVEDPKADPLVITECVFTGAAVLRKDRAAYHSTSLAASAAAEQEKEMKDQIDKVLAALDGISTRLTKVEEGMKVSASSGVLDKVKPHADALESCAAAMEAAGIGAHPKFGHAVKLRHMAAAMCAEASMGKMPHIYNDHSWENDFRSSADNAAATAAAQSKELKDLSDGLASLTTIVKDLKASADKQALDGSKPERKTLPPAIMASLSKLGLAEGDDGKISASVLDKAMREAGLDPTKRIELKVGLERAGRLTSA